MTPTIALALEDFLPVFFTLIALVFLCRIFFDIDRASGYIALLGTLLVVLGGFLKASGKINWALTGEQVVWMENSLFLLLAPGFALLAWSIWTGQCCLLGGSKPRLLWIVPTAVCIVIAAGSLHFYGSGEGSTWFLVLLALTVVMSSLMLILLSRQAWFYKLKGVALLFLLYLGITLVLNGMARTPSSSITVEWIKQITNTIAAVILIAAIWRLWIKTKEELELGKNLSPENQDPDSE
jgi:hypothetical protein